MKDGLSVKTQAALMERLLVPCKGSLSSPTCALPGLPSWGNGKQEEKCFLQPAFHVPEECKVEHQSGYGYIYI